MSRMGVGRQTWPYNKKKSKITRNRMFYKNTLPKLYLYDHKSTSIYTIYNHCLHLSLIQVYIETGASKVSLQMFIALADFNAQLHQHDLCRKVVLLWQRMVFLRVGSGRPKNRTNKCLLIYSLRNV